MKISKAKELDIMNFSQRENLTDNEYLELISDKVKRKAKFSRFVTRFLLPISSFLSLVFYSISGAVLFADMQLSHFAIVPAFMVVLLISVSLSNMVKDGMLSYKAFVPEFEIAHYKTKLTYEHLDFTLCTSIDDNTNNTSSSYEIPFAAKALRSFMNIVYSYVTCALIFISASVVSFCLHVYIDGANNVANTGNNVNIVDLLPLLATFFSLTSFVFFGLKAIQAVLMSTAEGKISILNGEIKTNDNRYRLTIHNSQRILFALLDVGLIDKKDIEKDTQLPHSTVYQACEFILESSYSQRFISLFKAVYKCENLDNISELDRNAALDELFLLMQECAQLLANEHSATEEDKKLKDKAIQEAEVANAKFELQTIVDDAKLGF